MGRYFGTDGIRAAAAAEVFQPPFLERLAGAALRVLAGERPSGGRPLIVLGRDPRHSGEAIARHLGACWAAAGACVLDAGVVPTPAVALAVREREASFGVVVTASHNPAADNGIKFFGAGGTKLSEALEAALEEAIEAESAPVRRLGGQVERIDGAEDYRRFASGQLPAGALAGCRLVVDCAHGAAAETTPAVLRALGAEVSALGVMPDGHNINAGVGSEAPAALAAQVRATGAHLGLAHDGDGDRVLFVDETGTVVPGDAVLALLARHLLREGALAEQTLVATVMSNFALDRWMERLGGRLVRTPVGDRQVLHRMLEGGFDLGGDPPEVAARAILDAAENPQRDVFVGGGAAGMSALGRVASGIMDRVMEATMFDQ
ncbi:MAG: phosphoglucosamine mutase, partial [Opitutales bacterium]